VQSALLEAMQERQVTIGEQTYKLPDPFLVLATQNPLEQEGTYQLPEAQLDRFMLKLRVGYPTKAEERSILDLMATSQPKLDVNAITEPAEILRARELVNSIYVDDRVKDYIVDVVFATREPASYRLKLDGYDPLRRVTACDDRPYSRRPCPRLSERPRLRHAAGYQERRLDVLRHRIIVSYEAEAEEMSSEQVIARIFDGLPVP
jgi:MoxR-like ATPase